MSTGDVRVLTKPAVWITMYLLHSHCKTNNSTCVIRRRYFHFLSFWTERNLIIVWNQKCGQTNASSFNTNKFAQGWIWLNDCFIYSLGMFNRYRITSFMTIRITCFSYELSRVTVFIIKDRTIWLNFVEK